MNFERFIVGKNTLKVYRASMLTYYNYSKGG